jgi:hypothetical protein
MAWVRRDSTTERTGSSDPRSAQPSLVVTKLVIVGAGMTTAAVVPPHRGVVAPRRRIIPAVTVFGRKEITEDRHCIPPAETSLGVDTRARRNGMAPPRKKSDFFSRQFRRDGCPRGSATRWVFDQDFRHLASSAQPSTSTAGSRTTWPWALPSARWSASLAGPYAADSRRTSGPCNRLTPLRNHRRAPAAPRTPRDLLTGCTRGLIEARERGRRRPRPTRRRAQPGGCDVADAATCSAWRL